LKVVGECICVYGCLCASVLVLCIFPVHQELSFPLFLVVKLVGRGIFGDMGANQPELPLAYSGIAIREVPPSFPEALHLAALQDHSRLKGLYYLVVEAGLAVFADFLNAHIRPRRETALGAYRCQ